MLLWVIKINVLPLSGNQEGGPLGFSSDAGQEQVLHEARKILVQSLLEKRSWFQPERLLFLGQRLPLTLRAALPISICAFQSLHLVYFFKISHLHGCFFPFQDIRNEHKYLKWLILFVNTL